MSKRLVITFGDAVLYDGEPAKVTFSETETAFKLEAGAEAPNMLEQIAAAARQQRPRQLQQ